MTAEERLLSKISKDASGCWLYQGSVNHAGYGLFWFDGRYLSAHRVAYEFWKGEIPEGLQLDHLCRVRHCINPAHMEPVTGKENRQRAMRDTCKYGHLFTVENTYVDKRGQRDCWTCRYRRTREWKQLHATRTI